jgi:hypothetical protein
VAVRGYATVPDIEDRLALSLTVEQSIAAEALIEAAEAYVDREAGRSWLAGAVTDEAHYAPAGPLLWLANAPLASASVTVKARTGPTATETTLVAGTDYEVEDLTTGRIRLLTGWDYDRVRVTYTPSTTVDPLATQAVVLLVAHWLSPALRGDGSVEAIKGIEYVGDLRIDYATVTQERGLPVGVESILRALRGKGGLVLA